MDTDRRNPLFREVPANRGTISFTGSTVWKAWKGKGENNWTNECKEQQVECGSQENCSIPTNYCRNGAESEWASGSLPSLEHDDSVSTGNTQKVSWESWGEGSYGVYDCQEDYHCSDSAYAHVVQPGLSNVPVSSILGCGRSKSQLDVESRTQLYYHQQQQMLWCWYMYCAAACRAMSLPPHAHEQCPSRIQDNHVCPEAAPAIIGCPHSSDAATQVAPTIIAEEEQSLLCEESGEGLIFETRKRGEPEEVMTSRFESHKRVKRMATAESRVCSNCGTANTPFWRKDKHDGRPLCNACGLYSAKNDAQRPRALWKFEVEHGEYR